MHLIVKIFTCSEDDFTYLNIMFAFREDTHRDGSSHIGSAWVSKLKDLEVVQYGNLEISKSLRGDQWIIEVWL